MIIPTYNERDNVGSLIPAILSSDPRIHVLIVDDASPDDTAGVVRALQSSGNNGRLFMECRSGKLGLGSAYIHGMQWGLANGYDFLIQMDADWSHSPDYLKTMLRLGEEYDFVLASRYVPGGGTTNWGFGRRMLSRFSSYYSRLILGVNLADFTGGFNGWSRSTLKDIGLNELESDGYSFQIELKHRAHRLGYKHIEFPIVFHERRRGKSKMSLSIALEACWRVWHFRLTSRIAGKKAGQLSGATKDDKVPDNQGS